MTSNLYPPPVEGGKVYIEVQRDCNLAGPELIEQIKSQVELFAYDNHTFIVESFQPAARFFRS